MIPDDAGALRGFLAERDVAFPNCGYDLRGLTKDACPECNQPLVLGVSLAEARMGAMLGTLAALFGMGVTGLLFVLVAVGLSVRWGDYPPGEFFVIPGIGACVGMLGGLLLARRAGRIWFRRLSRGWALALLIGSWATVIGAALLFMVQIVISSY
jgi:hypothetical protein